VVCTNCVSAHTAAFEDAANDILDWSATPTQANLAPGAARWFQGLPGRLLALARRRWSEPAWGSVTTPCFASSTAREHSRRRARSAYRAPAQLVWASEPPSRATALRFKTRVARSRRKLRHSASRARDRARSHDAGYQRRAGPLDPSILDRWC